MTRKKQVINGSAEVEEEKKTGPEPVLALTAAQLSDRTMKSHKQSGVTAIGDRCTAT